jgi:hypothetical protein
MEYLKTYKMFEQLDYNEIKQTCRDILLELSDCGYEISFGGEIGPALLTTNLINVFIRKSTEFTFDDIREVVHRLVDYLEFEGFEPSYYYKGNRIPHINTDVRFTPSEYLIQFEPSKNFRP